MSGRYIGGTQQTGHKVHGLNRQVYTQCCLAVWFGILNPPKKWEQPRLRLPQKNPFILDGEVNPPSCCYLFWRFMSRWVVRSPQWNLRKMHQKRSCASHVSAFIVMQPHGAFWWLQRGLRNRWKGGCNWQWFRFPVDRIRILVAPWTYDKNTPSECDATTQFGILLITFA